MSRSISRRTTALAAALTLAATAGAEPPGPESLDVIVVTATRTATRIGDALVPVTVIDRREIAQSLATDLAEILRFEAGLDIGRSGGPGQSTSLFLRGSESNHTLVLVDGVRINPGTIGGAAIQNIAPEVIERIEIVKGARSALFGTDAIGGVINIITRRAERSYAEVGLGGGSFDTRSAYFGGGVSGETGEVGATLNWQRTDGYPPRTDSDIDRGYDNTTVNIYGLRRFSGGDVTLRHWQAVGNVQYLDFLLTPVDQDFRNQSTAIEVNHDFGEDSASRLILSHVVDDIRQSQVDDFVTSRRLGLDWQYSMPVDEHLFTGGLYLANEHADVLSFGSGFDEDTRIRALFVQDQWHAGRHSAFVAARYTDHQAFGGRFTWNLEYGMAFGERWSAYAGLGRAFRAPDATDRFGFGGNIGLDPEIATEAEFGIRYRPSSRQQLRLEIYRNLIHDLIEFDLADFSLHNIGEAEIRGAQLGYEWAGEGFSLRADLVRQKAEDAGTGERLLQRAEDSLTVGVTRYLGAHSLGVSLLASGDREGFGATLPGYVLVDLTGQLNLGAGWRLNARIENLLDAQYQTVAQYRMQGRSVYAELRYGWQ